MSERTVREVTIADIIAMKPGEDIPAFRCVLRKVGVYKADTNSFGPYSLQNLTGHDGKDEIKIKLDGRPELGQEWANKSVVFIAAAGTKKPYLDLKRDVDTYRESKNPMVKVGKLAIMDQVSKAPAPQPEPGQRPAPDQTKPENNPRPPDRSAQTTRDPAPAPQNNPVAVPAQSKPPADAELNPKERKLPDEPVVAAKHAMGQAANGLIFAFDAAVYVRDEVVNKHPDLKFSTSDVKEMAVHLSIQLERRFLVHKLPAGKIKKTEPKSKS